MGEVGEGRLAGFGDCPPPVADTVRCEDAIIAAAEGLRLFDSGMILPSGIGEGAYVGDAFFGVGADHIAPPFREPFLEMPALPCGGGASIGDALLVSWL